MASLLAVSSTSLVIPAALNYAYDNHNTEQSLSSILLLSRGTAIILLILYVFYLYFTLKSHSQLFEESETCGSPEKRREAQGKSRAQGGKNLHLRKARNQRSQWYAFFLRQRHL